MKRPGRPLGVALAILMGVLIFSIGPLLQVGMILVVQNHFANLQFPDDWQPYAMGGDYIGLPLPYLVFQVIGALVFLLAAILAWRGRPASIRFVLVVVVIIMTIIQFLSVFLLTPADSNLQNGISSGDSFFRMLGMGQFGGNLLMTLYIAWYMNRGPARAFYRGYYLPAPTAAPTTDTQQAETVRQN